MNKGFNNGLLAGIVGIIIMLIAYFVDQNFYMNYANWVVYLAFIYFMYMAGKQAREAQGGFIGFGGALGPIFLTFAVGSLLVIILQYIMYNFIDPSLLDAMYDQAVKQIEKMSGLIGEEGTEIALEQLEEKGVSFGIGQVIIGWITSLIPGIIISLILSAILKKQDKSVV